MTLPVNIKEDYLNPEEKSQRKIRLGLENIYQLTLAVIKLKRKANFLIHKNIYTTIRIVGVRTNPFVIPIRQLVYQSYRCKRSADRFK
ncbi:MAG: hypothetical protein IPI96_14835 [Saprospiraceae bacterium]|nr:hypothetical protein [Saprospiraceae bacterium]